MSAAPPAATPVAGGAPLIITAELPADLAHWADSLRREHYPPERNQLKAHVTLFHAMAPSLMGELKTLLAALAGECAPPPARLSGLLPLGGGTALAIDCPAMLAIREDIASHFHGALTSQDSHAPRLHITVQNKVSPQEAKALQRELSAQLDGAHGIGLGYPFRFAGLALHHYRGGPWEPAGRWSFRGAERGGKNPKYRS
ncbi:MAG: 2'-5' RNA ligase family protein [Novosphingobium sp.]